MTEPTDTSLLERSAELATLSDKLAAARTGDGSMVLVEGPAGIGKTEMVSHLLAEAKEAGLTTMFARGGEIERDFALGVARQLVEPAIHRSSTAGRAELFAGSAALAAAPLGVELEGSGPGVTPETGDAPFAVIHGLYWLVYNLTTDSPTLIVVDDAHWSDAPSLRFLIYLAKRIQGLPALLVVTTRSRAPEGQEVLLAQLSAETQVVLGLAGLSSDAVAAKLRHAFGTDAHADFVAACSEATGGNPYLLGELVVDLSAREIEPVAENAGLVESAVPASLPRLVEARLASLPDAARPLAKAIALLGREADLRLACTLAELEPSEAARAVDAMVAAHLLAPGRPLRFQHPIVREAVYASLGEMEASALHARAFAELHRSGLADAASASHLLYAPAEGNPDAVAALREAGRDALGKGAVEQAQRYLRRALAEPPPDQVRGDLLSELAATELLVHEDAEAAVEHIRESLELTPDEDTRMDRMLTLARALVSIGRLPEAAQELEITLEAASDSTTVRAVRLRAELDAIGLMLPELTDEAEARIHSMERPTRADPADLLVLANIASNSWGDGTADDAATLAQQALADGGLIRAEGPGSLMAFQLIWVLAYADRWAEAERAVEIAHAESTARGSTFGLAGVFLMRSLIAWRRGEVPRAESQARAVQDLGEIAPPVGVPLASIYLTHALIERGELADAAEAIALSGCGPYLPELIHTNPAFHARARLRLAEGDARGALSDLDELRRRDERLNVRNPGDPWRATAVEAHLALGESDDARRAAAEQFELAKHWGTESAIGVAHRARGLADGQGGIDDLERSVEILAETEQRLEHARSLVALGAAIRDAGSPVDARDPLRDALDLARRCGSSALVDRARRELVAAGAKPRRLSFSGSDSLTASERRIAILAASGHTNRDIAEASFVTVKTVENHLNHCYQKLGISSRRELGDALGAAYHSEIERAAGELSAFRADYDLDSAAAGG